MKIKSSVILTLLLCVKVLGQTFVDIGNVNNTSDTTGFGSVGYNYKIGKYEVTTGEWVSFLNSVATATDQYNLYNPNQSITRTGNSGNYSYQVAGSSNKPINYVNWFDAARYINWLQNGKSSTSSTEDGAYTLNGATTGTLISRNQNATYFLPNLNEWYKAAYYDPNKNGTGGYWLFPTKSDIAPGNLIGATPNEANYFTSSTGQATFSDFRLTDVGSFTSSASAYGTFDQGGNVWEWNELVLSATQRGQRGGSVYSSDYLGTGDLSSGIGNKKDNWNIVDQENLDIGFRIAGVPEPSALSLLTVGLGGLAMIRRRRS